MRKNKQVYIRRGFFFMLLWTLFWPFAYIILTMVCKVKYRYKIKGKHNLKRMKKSGCVIVCNHCHTMDSVMVSLACWPRKTRTAALEANMKIKGLNRIMPYFGAVGIPKSPIDLKRFLAELTDEAKRGRRIVFMPEGHLIKDCSELREFKDGAFFLAKKAGVPIIPAAYSYILNKKGEFNYTLHIGQPIDTQALPVAEIRDKAFSVMQEFTKDNKRNVELRYGDGAYSGDPEGEALMRLMHEQNTDRNHLTLS